ncbi:class I SAM-dependent methyltransferase [Calothrix sp. PCC 6303]|uniref:class I SAM-dependent methyltransferase n=1 Tax=Calothrix sp. PCC 6303 TaxID=1170562 RepID=UPI0002A0296B|nr:class I SAM-dependent methyltransferase [Calothrix sp. PCC 6303]AFZ02372.1 Methyltransferase type 12 [Calothrix sp. PCC 6303]
MLTFPTPSSLSSYWQDSFHLKQHLQDFLHLDSQTLEAKLTAGQQQMAELGRKDFDWEQASAFYSDKVGEVYLFELGAWHLTSHDYIGDMLRLIAAHAQGRVLDFGGGIGTHAIATALCPQVEQVIYCDLNPISCNFVRYRVKQMGLEQKIICYEDLPQNEKFDTILCFDVLEHLPNPSQQLLKFHQALEPQGKIILNWYFSKGFNQEFPFHLDDPQIISEFFHTLQSNFIEVFHPYHITTRCYHKLS